MPDGDLGCEGVFSFLVAIIVLFLIAGVAWMLLTAAFWIIAVIALIILLVLGPFVVYGFVQGWREDQHDT